MESELTYLRAKTLFDHGKYQEAEKELQILMGQTPDDIFLILLYAETLIQLDKTEEAIQIINHGLSIESDSDLLLYTLAKCQLIVSKDKEARKSIQAAIEYNPEDADYFALLAKIHLSEKDYQESYDAANQALAFDAENSLALNVKSTASIKLGLKEEMTQTIEDNLHKNPNDSHTHAIVAMNLLEAKEYKKALRHAEEAMMINPNDELAQWVILESLRCKYFIYKIFFAFQTWLGNLKGGQQWLFIIGFYFGAKYLGKFSADHPEYAPYIDPVIYILALFAFSTWIIQPLSNMILSVNRYGKFLLSDQKKRVAKISLFLITTGLISLIISLFVTAEVWLSIGIFALLMMIPTSRYYDNIKGNWLMIIGLVIIIGLGLMNIFIGAMVNVGFSKYTVYFIYSIVAFQFGANFLSTKK
ncbi:tetratricopeptide repeat protein [Flammeovirga sp. MY04]|uniref:tetratricopeptide repeat protein n=1 Tax=Flammeovirga sp. MY04 TaxID=1191459 RepID=UPI0008061E1E|nr:tetratricopeptide repeat protein [Flammeovirga sp. MY04]ANQ49904.1 tetratricopeptide repeat protein [Flammeovirga sp. MY04]